MKVAFLLVFPLVISFACGSNPGRPQLEEEVARRQLIEQKARYKRVELATPNLPRPTA
jgi:hypothetical protein